MYGAEARTLHKCRSSRNQFGQVRLDAFAIQSSIAGIKQMLSWAAPVLFGPGTLWRTWGTRPVSNGFCWEIESCRVALFSVLELEEFAQAAGLGAAHWDLRLLAIIHA